MTLFGLCHNANAPQSCLAADHARAFKPAWARTITYWRGEDDLSAWDATIACCRTLRGLGVSNLVVFNTEAYGGRLDDLGLMRRRLEDFLVRAEGAVQAIEPGNELDTPGWTADGEPGGPPITDELIVEIGRVAAEVCHRRGVRCLSPSLLGGPAEGHDPATGARSRFERVAAGLVGHVDAMCAHPYGRSVNGQPEPGWIHGTLEDAAEDCRALGSGLHTWFSEVGCWTRFGARGFAGQRDFLEQLVRFDHPSIDVICYFTAFDAAVPAHELEAGKDFGLITTGGEFKPACGVFGIDDVITGGVD